MIPAWNRTKQSHFMFPDLKLDEPDVKKLATRVAHQTTVLLCDTALPFSHDVLEIVLRC